ncbi:MAG TPA: hypothetical protein VHG71_06610 [Verrucomicrobiae bacterium]|nr:hypothetical protein [Verrucomicrobiae bacterium]
MNLSELQTNASFQASLYSLYNFTKMRVESARCSARHGHKDEASNFLRYVRGASIVQILKCYQNDGVLDIDLSHLEWQLRELENDCHPMTQPDFKDDFALILLRLDSLAHCLSKLQPAQTRNIL